MPFGLQGAPSCFQRLMNHYLRHYLGKFVLVYLDDILIYSNSEKEHMKHIKIILDILRDKQLFAKPSKCDFFRTQVQFLGYIISEGQIATDPAKISAVKDWPIPKTIREVRSFLGLCNFYRKFIEKHSEIAKPLTNLLKSTEFKQKFGCEFTKTAKVDLGPAEVAAFEKLKETLISAPCLVIYDPDKPTEVWADASFDYATTGAVLMQDHGLGWQPVAFMSKVMTLTESRYPTFEQELLALKKALEEWRHYLLPVQFIARTDHNGLKYLKTQKHLSERQWHWLAFFSEYQFDLNYRPRKQMEVPDSLSRRPQTELEIADLLRLHPEEQDNTKFEIPITMKDGQVTKILLHLHKTLHTKTKKSKELENFDYTNYPDFGEIYKTLDPKKPSTSLYYKHNKLLYWVDRKLQHHICVPKNERVNILHEFHDSKLAGHFGAAKVLHNLQRKFIWPNMKTQVELYTSSCDLCQKNKTWHQKPFGMPQLPIIADEPWENVSMDFCGPFPLSKTKNDYILVVMDNLTKRAILIPCTKTTNASQTAELFIKHIFKDNGLPKYINCDCEPQFVSNFWKHLWKNLNTVVKLSAPYHPQSNSIVERQNKTFQEAL
eukprot:1692827-Rhodomonas_salina.2